MARRPSGEHAYDARLAVRGYQHEITRWQAMAAQTGESLSEAVRRVLNAAWPARPLNRRGEPRPPGWYPGYWKAKRAWEAANPGVPFLPAKKQRKP